MDAIQNMLKEETDEEEKIDIETHFLPATPGSEEEPLERLYFSAHNHTKFISQGNYTDYMLEYAANVDVHTKCIEKLDQNVRFI